MLYDLTVQLRPLRHQLLYLVLCAVSLLDQTLQFTFVIVTVFIDVVRPFASGLFSVYSSCLFLYAAPLPSLQPAAVTRLAITNHVFLLLISCPCHPASIGV